MKRTTSLAFALTLASGTLLQAQFGGLLKKEAKPAASAVDADAVLANGTKLIVFSTLATDLAVDSATKMLEAFPAAKVASIKNKFAKYNELKAKRASKDQMDADSCTLATDAFDEMAKLDVAGYEKAKAKVVVPAYGKLGLAVGADGLAAAQLPDFVKSAQGTASSLASNPMQASKAAKLQAQIVIANALVTNTPKQITAMKTVRGIAKKIADAEKFKLGEPKALTTLDVDALSKENKALDIEG